MSTDSLRLGSSKLDPAPEGTLLEEEKMVYTHRSRFSRVLMSFLITVKDQPSALEPHSLRTQTFEGVEVIGAVGVLYGKAGMFAQAGWFGGENDLDWMWIRIKDVTEIQVRRDIRFRKGEPCVWLHTKLGDYAMGLPRREYIDNWEATIHNLGACAAGASFEMWPRQGVRPCWWERRWEHHWPFDKPAKISSLGKRPSSTDLDGLHAVTRGNSGWQPELHLQSSMYMDCDSGRLPAGAGHVPSSLLHQRSAWVLRSDGGLRSIRGSEEGEEKANRRAKGYTLLRR